MYNKSTNVDSVFKRPYAIPEKTLRVFDDINHRYDQMIESFLSSIFRAPWSRSAIKLSITNRCNLKCDYCYDRWRQPPNRPPVDMSSEFVEKVFRTYPEPLYTFVLGGEPFLNTPALKAVLKHAPNRLAISTNGQIVTREIFALLEQIPKRNSAGLVTILQVSCDLGGASSSRGTMNNSASEERLLRIKSKTDPYLKVKFTLTEEDLPHLKTIADWYWERGLLLQIDYADGGSDGSICPRLSAEGQRIVYEFALAELFRSLDEWLSDQHNIWPIRRIRTLMNHALAGAIHILDSQLPIRSSCGLLGNSIYIGPDKRLYPCHRWNLSKPAYGLFGNKIKEQQTAFHRKQVPKIIEHCAKCIWRGNCGWLCPAVTCIYGHDSLEMRCRFMGALWDAVWTFLTDLKIMANSSIDKFLAEIKRTVTM